MKKYSSNYILYKSKQYESLAISSYNYELKKLGMAGLAVGVLSVMIPAIIGMAKEKSLSSKSLQEAIDKVNKELGDLNKILVNPIWEGLGTTTTSFLTNVGAGAAAGAATGAIIGSVVPVAGTTVGAAVGVGIGTLGAILGGLIGAGASVHQINKLTKTLPDHKKVIDDFSSEMQQLSNVYDKITNIDSRKDDISQENYNYITGLINEYNRLLRKVQIKCGVVSADIAELKNGFTEFSDTLAQYNLNISSDLKDVEDAIGKLGPQLTKTLMSVDDLTDAIKKKEKEVVEKTTDSKESISSETMGELSW